MGDIVLTAGVRQNLLSLQNTAALMATTQNRLATGKKVNTALDNPINFFTSQSLSNRASDLSSLLDSIGQAQQTLKSADDGITSLTKLVQTAKSIATQAVQATKGTVNYSNITGTAVLPDDTTRVTSANSAATSGAVSVQAESGINAAGIGQLASGDTLVFQLGASAAVTATFGGATALGTNTFADAAGLIAVLNGGTGASGHFATTAAVASTDGAGGVQLQSADVTNDFTVSATSAGLSAANFANLNTAHTLGDAFTVSDGTYTNTFYRVAAVVGTGTGTYSNATDLAANITASTVHTLGAISATATGAGSAFLQLTTPHDGSVSVSGAISTAMGFNSTPYSNNYNSAISALSGSLDVSVGTNAAHTLDFGTGNGQIATKTALNAALAAFNDVTGSVNSSSQVNFNPTSSDDITIGGTAAVLLALGLSAGATTPTSTVVSAATTRASLQDDFNAMLRQIDQMASDSSYNGINLLYGDHLKVVFNENGTSLLDIPGVKFDAAGLGLASIAGTGFQDDHNINDLIAKLDNSMSMLRTQSSKFGSTLTTVEARQNFTKNMINTLETGADNLVLADTNEEGANMLALQTRQSLSTTALSLANQASQAVLRLFG